MEMIRWNGLLKCRPASSVTSSTRPKVVTMPVYPVCTVAVQVSATARTSTTAAIKMIIPFFIVPPILSQPDCSPAVRKDYHNRKTR